MPILQKAIEASFKYYQDHLPGIREKANEHGYVLWKEADGGLVNSCPMIGPDDGSEIDLYDAVTGHGFELLKHYVAKDWTYVGDYHTHPNASEYPKELPSDSDLFRWGAMCDLCPLWELWPLFQKSACFASLRDVVVIPVTQEFQLIQPARFGDIILVRPVPGRPVFTHLKEQKDILEPKRVAYKSYVLSTGHSGSIREDRSTYRSVMNEHIANIMEIVGDRVTLEYCENVHAPTL